MFPDYTGFIRFQDRWQCIRGPCCVVLLNLWGIEVALSCGCPLRLPGRHGGWTCGHSLNICKWLQQLESFSVDEFLLAAFSRCNASCILMHLNAFNSCIIALFTSAQVPVPWDLTVHFRGNSSLTKDLLQFRASTEELEHHLLAFGLHQFLQPLHSSYLIDSLGISIISILLNRSQYIVYKNVLCKIWCGTWHWNTIPSPLCHLVSKQTNCRSKSCIQYPCIHMNPFGTVSLTE